MALSKKSIIELYRKRGKRYDISANLYYLLGFREQAYRKKAVEALGLHKGDTVVEIGCGTGLNFPLLHDAVGESGKIIGVDLTDAMLAQAEKRVKENGWSNVELVHSDVTQYRFPEGVSGIISTFALTLVPEFDEVIRNGRDALEPGGRWVILDFKFPSNWLSSLTPLAIFLMRPFGVTEDLAERHLWESIGNYFEDASVTNVYGGFAYIAAGMRNGSDSPQK
jgi:demethylmenaquinone methyltransferase/2-methoxy-6-polyprenyl-1,4-benzoquinol methylase